MRVLIVTVAEKPHFLNMVPLGWALVDAGHEVRVASQPELMDVVADTGLTGVPVGKDHNYWRVMRTFDISAQERSAPFTRLAEAPYEKVSLYYLQDSYERAVQWWWRMLNDPMVDDLVTYCHQWKPDLVVWETLSFSGAIAARACGAAHGRLLWGADLFGRMRGHYLRKRAEITHSYEDPLARWLGVVGERHGVAFSEELVLGEFTVDYLPEPLRLTVDPEPSYVPMRFLPYNGSSVLPDWLREPPERPRICLSLGVSATEKQGGYAVAVPELLEAIADLDVEVVATLPGTDQDLTRRLPDHVRVVTTVPLNALLATCSAAVNHGGWGTTLACAAYGVPQLVLPSWFDNALLARRIAAHGSGLSIDPDKTDPARVRSAVARLVEEPMFTTRARELAGLMAAAPGPGHVVGLLEDLARRSGTNDAVDTTPGPPHN